VIEHLGEYRDFDSIIAGEVDPFGLDDTAIEWRPKTHHTVQRDVDGRPIAHVGLLVTDVQAGAERFEVVGVGGVIVTQSHRGQGLLRPLLEAALAQDLGPDRALLWCTTANAEIYARFGFEHVTAPVTVDQAAGPYVMPMPTMWKPLREGVTWPAGDVRVPGLPF
jgi:predicted GNAT family N-acyltransferase